jgi:hypothetical protein
MRLGKLKGIVMLTLFFLFLVFTSCKKGKGAICNDGWRSHSTGSGTCSWHGGIDHYIDPDETDVFKTSMLIVLIIGGVVVIRFVNKG